jgi:hypothetical protein
MSVEELALADDAAVLRSRHRRHVGGRGLRAIAGDWCQRVADFETFRSAELRSHLRRSGIEIIGWRPLRELMRDRGCHPSPREKT